MHCHICNNSNVSPLDKALEVYECTRCGHEFSALPPDKQETYSPDYFREMHRKWFEHPNIPLFKRINSVVEDTAHESSYAISFLDVGCGQGDLLRYMEKAGSRAQLFGIDLVQNKDEGITYYQGDFVSFPFTQRFDIVLGLMVIEHIGNPHGFVRKMTSILSPRGMVIINTVNASGFLYALARFLRRFGVRGPFERLYDKHHLEHYRKCSLRALFESHGYRVVSHRVHNFPLKAVDVPEEKKWLAFLYRVGIAAVFVLTARVGGVHQTLICQKQ